MLNSFKICFILVLLPLALHAQFTDDFSDGDFTNNPTWAGDDVKFEVASNVLHLNAPAVSDDAYLSIPSKAINNAVWEFYIQLDFNPSSSNYAEIFLVSNQTDLRTQPNGYLVKIGGSTDEISLYRNVGGSETEIIDGQDDRVNLNPVIVRVRVTRDNAGNWELLSDTTGGTNYQSEGTAFDDNFIQSNYFGVFCNYTSTRSDLFYFDDFNVSGDPFLDTFPPAIDTVTVLSNNSLLVEFTETIEQSSAETVNNYFVNNGIGIPSAAFRDVDSSKVQLTFTTPFQNGIWNTLTVNNIADLEGNILSTDSKDFIYFVADTPEYRDVIINEIFAAPSSGPGLPNAEFVELYNRSNKVFDLSGWSFSDASGPANLTSKVLLPEDYLILCSNSDVSSFTSYGDVLGVSGFPSLNNTGDDLSLRGLNNLLLDEVNYSDDWYKDDDKDNGGWSLERIDPEFPCPTADNWSASLEGIGGTPGRQNSIFGTLTDTTAPQVLNFEILSQISLKLIFNEPLDSASAAALTNYVVDNGIGNPNAILLSPDRSEVELDFSMLFDSTHTYTLQINGLTDCIGNMIAGENIVFALPSPADQYDVVINEIFPNPEPQVGLPEVEYVELFNRSDKTISLKDWRFADASSSTSLPNRLLLPGDYLILAPAESEHQFRPFGDVEGLAPWPSLSNSSEELTLTDASGQTIFYVNYTSEWYHDAIKAQGGWSLEMIDPGNPCGMAENWRASADASGGTPGTVNSVFADNPDETAPGIYHVLVEDSLHVRVIFDEIIDDFSASQAANYSIDQGITVIDPTQVLAPAFSQVILTLNTPLLRNTIYTLEINGVLDCSGNEIGLENEASFGIPERPDSLDLVINEILSNPVTGGKDFIEVYNRSDKVVDLAEVIIAEIDPIAGDTNSAIVAEDGFQLLPGEYIALTESPSNILKEYFTPNPKFVYEVADLPTYADDEDIVLLLNRFDNNKVIDRVHYYEDWQFALIDDLNGVSLERISFERPSQDKNNWHSAASTVGYATPAYQNSQFGDNTPSASAITLEPEVFSPNNDGYQDFLNIKYRFDQPGYVTNITFYDDDGHRIRRLVENKLLEVEGTLTWDGTDDDGNKARVGIYIMIAEVFNLEGKVSTFKKSCVLAGRF